MELNIKDLIVNLLSGSDTTVNKLYQFVNGKEVNPTKAEFEKFKKNLIASVKARKENALELFPIIKYFESKRLTEEDYADDEVLFTMPSGERIAVASPIEVLEEIPEKSSYNMKFEWDLTHIDERESLVNKAVWNYYEIIKDLESIKNAVKSWGRFVEESIYISKIEKEMFAENVPQEVFALHQSDNLNALLPTEIAQLDDPELEFIFYKNFIEKKLLSYQLWGIEREIVEDITITKKDLDDKGPLFICIDTSGSMRGITEVVSKALVLATVNILSEYGINVVLIPFSTQSKPLDLSESKNKVKAARDWLKKSYYGGSDFGQLLDVLSSFMGNRQYAKANIVIFSDFIFKNIDPSIAKKMKVIQDRTHSFHSLKISKKNNKNSIEKMFSSNWQYIFNWKGNDEGFDEEDLIKQISDANINARNSLDEIISFGFIKRIKDYEYARKNASKEKEQENDQENENEAEDEII
ncbi:VWA domain-containing protein [Malacoplasma muris]|uniref:VWA domain-containing protein n=1 Tax=Malacoplasma muris TaxID=2119 RepID=UPI00398E7217